MADVVDLSIVIVTWNTREITSECLDSLRHCTGERSLEVIVVDNASSDGTPEMVAERYPEVNLVRNQENLGFAGANNIGIRRCLGKYVCLVNSDVVLPPKCLDTMFRYMETHSDIGVLGPLMRLADGSVGDSCMRFPTVANWFCRALALDTAFKRWRRCGGFLMTDFHYDKTTDVDVLTGWFWMVRDAALKHAGLLDERFFMYGEDIEWCRRFHDAGWRVVFYPEAEAVHYCAASSANAPTRFYVEMQRANMQYFRMYHGRVAQVAFWAASCLHQITRIAGHVLSYLIRPASRPAATHKISRSMACLRWLFRFEGLAPRFWHAVGAGGRGMSR